MIHVPMTYRTVLHNAAGDTMWASELTSWTIAQDTARRILPFLGAIERTVQIYDRRWSECIVRGEPAHRRWGQG